MYYPLEVSYLRDLPSRKFFVSGLGDQGSISGQVILKTQKMVLYVPLLNAQHYKVRIKSKWSNPEREVAPFLHLSVLAIEKRTFRSPSTTIGQLSYSTLICLLHQISSSTPEDEKALHTNIPPFTYLTTVFRYSGNTFSADLRVRFSESQWRQNIDSSDYIMFSNPLISKLQ